MHRKDTLFTRGLLYYHKIFFLSCLFLLLLSLSPIPISNTTHPMATAPSPPQSPPAKYSSDVDYAKRVCLPSLMDELVSHVVAARSESPLEEIQKWAARKLAEAAPPAEAVQQRSETLSPCCLMLRLVEDALEEYFEGGLAAVKRRVSEESVKEGVERLLLAISALRAVLGYEAEILFPMIDRNCHHAATIHLLYQATDDLQKRLAETRVLLPSLLDVSEDGHVSPVYLADLMGFVKSYTLHASHKMSVVQPSLASLTLEQQFYPLQLAFASSADKAPLVTLVVTHLVESDRPYTELKGFLSVVREASSSDAEYAKHHVPSIKKAVARSALHMNLLKEDGLLS